MLLGRYRPTLAVHTKIDRRASLAHLRRLIICLQRPLTTSGWPIDSGREGSGVAFEKYQDWIDMIVHMRNQAAKV